MKTATEVYVRSHTRPSNLQAFKDSYDMHYYFEINYRGVYHWLREQGWSKGRVFEPECGDLLPLLNAVGERCEEQLRVYDLGSFGSRLKALFSGVRRTPTVVIAGKKYAGLEAAREALRSVLAENA